MSLLTIAIPTYKRKNLLKRCIDSLITQIKLYPTEIELVISDNFSNDGSKKLLLNLVEKEADLNIRLFFQNSNTGYFGNFKKVRELSNSKYLWILSDNDIVLGGSIERIIKILKSEKDIAGIFLQNNWVKISTYEKLTLNEFVNLKLLPQATLISSVIFSNNKENDNDINSAYKNNLFLGFLYFLVSFINHNQILYLKGKVFKSLTSSASFDVFTAWTKDINDCIYFAESKELFTFDMKVVFINNIIKEKLYYQFIAVLLNKKIENIFYHVENVYEILRVYYKEFSNFEIIESAYNRPNLINYIIYFLYENSKLLLRLKNKMTYKILNISN